MSNVASCALCGQSDLIGAGVCASCADDGRSGTLLFLLPSRDLGKREDIATRLRHWAGPQTQLREVREALKGRQPVARLPEPLAVRAAAMLAEHGIGARAIAVDQWYRALPANFVLMLILVALLGAYAGAKTSTVLLFLSPPTATLLMLGAALQLRRPIRPQTVSHSSLPAATRSALAGALAQLHAGRVRELVLEVARVGEATYRSLPDSFRDSNLGPAVLDLMTETGALALETERLGAIAFQLEQGSDEPRGAGAAQLRVAVSSRVALLEQIAAVLARIARQGASSEDAAAAEAGALLDRVRAESNRKVEAETEVGRLLSVQPD
ncbi:MAG: hypothetical protein ACRERX_14455 [Pseudomonas sp.]